MSNKWKLLYQAYRQKGLDYTMNLLVQRYCLGRSDDYEHWIKKHEKKSVEKKLEYTPCFSIVVPVYNVKNEQLKACIESVIAQTYTNWQLCIVDDASTMVEVKETLEQYVNHPQINIIYRKENGHISRCTNDGISIAKGAFIAFLDCDDTIASNALYENALVLNTNRALDFIYSDEDLISESGDLRYSPRFKTGWMPDCFWTHNYTNHFSVYRADIVKKIGGLRVGYEGSQDYDFVLRFVEEISEENIYHIPKVLYHWRSRPESLASAQNAKNYAYEAAKNAKLSAMERTCRNGVLVQEMESLQYNVVYKVDGTARVSVLIQTKNNIKGLKKTLTSFITSTTYEDYEINVLDFSDMQKMMHATKKMCETYQCNYIYSNEENVVDSIKKCVGTMKGNYLLFMSDDVVITNSNWLEALVGQAQQKNVGAVGPRIMFENTNYVYSLGYVPLEKRLAKIYYNMEIAGEPFAKQNNNFVALDEKCFLIERNKFLKCTLSEQYKTAWCLVDLQLQLLKQGLRNAYVAESIVNINVNKKQDDETNKDVMKDKQKCMTSNQEIANYREYYYNENYSQVCANYRLEQKTQMVNKIENVKKSKSSVFAHGFIDYVVHDGIFQISGELWSEKKKRSLFDQIWVELVGINGESVYVVTRKTYQGGYKRGIYAKTGRKWAGFSGEVTLTKNIDVKEIRVYIHHLIKKTVTQVEMEII